MKQLYLWAASAFIALGGAVPAAFAQAAAPHGAMAGVSMEMTEGEVRKVDKEAGKITLRHGAIKHMDMPPMTMVFEVKDKNLLEKVRAGDRVKFAVSNESGKLTVTEIQAVR